MAAITAAASGNWNAPATWTGGVVPGNGDTVTIGGTKVITVTVNQVIGASNGVYSTGTTPNAAAILLTGTAGITLVAGVKLTARGDIVWNNNYNAAGPGYIQGPGATLELDSSLTSPTTTSYRMYPVGTNNMPSYKFAINGTQASPCFIQSNAGGANGGMVVNGLSGMGSTVATYTNFLRFGTASAACWQVSFEGGVSCSFSHCVFDTCGPQQVTTAPAGGQINSFTDCVWVNSLNTVYNTSNANGATYYNCVFDRGGPCGSDNVFYQASIQNCYFGGHFGTSGNSYKWALCNNVFFHHDGNDFNLQGDFTNSVVFTDCWHVNPHTTLTTSAIGTSQTFDNIIYEFTGQNDQGDGPHTGGKFTAPNTFYVKRTLTLPGAIGSCSVDALTCSNDIGPVSVENITYIIGTQGGTYGETYACPTNTIISWRNNIAWDTTARYFPLHDVDGIGSPSGIATDTVLPANADYNCHHNFVASNPASTWLTNQGNGYVGKFSSTPGVHDLHVDPQFTDITRNTATFDSAYLGNTAPTWASFSTSHTFAVGDIIANNNAIYYGGIVINFRCLTPHVKSTANTEPGGQWAVDWRPYWEFATCYRLRQALGSSALGNPTLITDSSLGLSGADYITALRTWIRAGFQPQNLALKGAGYNGLDIGAVPFAVTGGGTAGASPDLSLLGVG